MSKYEQLEKLARFNGGVQSYGRSSQLGTPLHSYCKLSDGKTELLLEAVIVDVGLENDLVVTPLYGLEGGAVIERTRAVPEAVTLRGFLLSGKGEEPKRQRQLLYELCRVGKELAVECPRLLEYNIQNIAIRRADLPQGPHYNLQPFQVYAIADRFVELVLNPRKNADTGL